MPTAAAYLRYSTDSQKPTSIEDQCRRCCDLAATENLTIEQEFQYADHAIQGNAKAIAKRVSLKRLMDAWDAGLIDFVFADELSRLTRDEADGALLLRKVRETGVVVITGDGIDTRRKDWETTWMFKLTMCGAEVRRIGERTSRTMEGLLVRGHMIAAPPFGYSVDWSLGRPGDGHEAGARWAINPESAELVRQMFELRRAGASATQIAARFNASNIPSPRNGRDKKPSYWRAATISRLLSNAVYKGMFVYQGSAFTRAKLARKRQTPSLTNYPREKFRLVSDDLWEACNPAKGVRRLRSGVKHVLAGFGVCGSCESKLSLRVHQTTSTLSCPGCEHAVRVGARATFTGYTSGKAATLALKASLRELLTGPVVAEFRERLRERLAVPKTDEEARLRAEVQRLSAGSDKLVRLSLNPGIGIEAVESQLAELRTDLTKARTQLDHFVNSRAPISKATVARQLAIDIDPLLDKVLDGEPVQHEARATLGRLVSRFAFVERPRRGCSVFEVTFAPGVYIADVAGAQVLDNERVTFRVTVSVSAKRPVVWDVSLVRL